jgi:hypothetical protein
MARVSIGKLSLPDSAAGALPAVACLAGEGGPVSGADPACRNCLPKGVIVRLSRGVEPSTVTPENIESEGERLRERATKKRGNPLYVWQAILLFTAYDLPLPDWCVAHIRTVAVNLHDLMQGVNPATAPVRAEGESDSNFAQRSMAWYRDPKFAPTDAPEFLPQALMLTRQGWNAFSELAADQEKMSDAMQYAATRREDEMDVIRRKRNLDHVRSARRRITEGRSLLGFNDGTKPRG